MNVFEGNIRVASIKVSYDIFVCERLHFSTKYISRESFSDGVRICKRLFAILLSCMCVM